MQKAVIDFTNNPELTNYALSKSAGDDVEITFKGKFTSSDGGKLEFSIDEVEVEYEDKETEIEPSIDEPISLEVFPTTDMEKESSKGGAKTSATGDEDALLLDEEDGVN